MVQRGGGMCRETLLPGSLLFVSWEQKSWCLLSQALCKDGKHHRKLQIVLLRVYLLPSMTHSGGKVMQVCLLAKDCSSLRSGFLSCDASILQASSFLVFLYLPTGTWESRRWVPVQSSFCLLSYKDPWNGCHDSSTPRVVVNMAWSNSLAFKQTKIFNHFRVVDKPLTWFPCVTWNTKFLDGGEKGEHWRWNPLSNSGVSFLTDTLSW